MPKRPRSVLKENKQISEEDEPLLKELEEGSISEDSVEEIEDEENKGTLIGEVDSDDEDHPLDQNTVGEVPMHWYDEYDHIGYNIVGDKIARPAMKDQMDSFLDREDNSNW